MSTFTRSTSPITISQNRPWSLPLAWQSPSGAPIDITSFTLTAELRPHRLAIMPLSVGVGVNVTDATAGKFAISRSAADLDGFPEGAGSELAIRLVDGAGASHDFEIPVIGVKP